jgi:hypothetical protein
MRCPPAEALFPSGWPIPKDAILDAKFPMLSRGQGAVFIAGLQSRVLDGEHLQVEHGTPVVIGKKDLPRNRATTPQILLIRVEIDNADAHLYFHQS